MARIIKWAALAAIIGAVLALASCHNNIIYIPPEDTTTKYSIVVHPKPQHGELKFSHDKAESQTLVKVYVLPAPGYVLKPMSLKAVFPRINQDTTDILSYGAYYYQFTMKAYDVEVTAEFIPSTEAGKFTVSVDPNISHGFIVPSISLGEPGGEVRINIFPENGYVLVPSSLMYKDTAGNVLGTLSSNLPHFLTIPNPGKDIVVTASFQQGDFANLLQSARSYMQAGQYDTAVNYFAEAYAKRAGGSTADVNEVIFYHSLGKLASILLDGKVRDILGAGKGRLHFGVVPSDIEGWMCDYVNLDASGNPFWDGVIIPNYGPGDERWYQVWRGIDYNNNNRDNKGYETEETVLFTPSTEVTDSIIMPKINARDSVDREMDGAFRGSLPDYNIWNNNPTSRQKYFNYMFWLMLNQQRDQGFNSLFDRIDTLFFGTAFEKAAEIAATLPDNAQVPLYDNLKKRFRDIDENDLGDRFYGHGQTMVGKAELDYIFGMIRMAKAALQYLRAIEWTTDVRPWLIGKIDPDFGIDQILKEAFTLGNNDDWFKKYWATPLPVQKILPLKNRFMEMKTPALINDSKNQFIRAFAMINKSMTTWFGEGPTYVVKPSSSNLSNSGFENNRWAAEGFSAVKTALASGDVFYFNKKLPKPAVTAKWPTSTNADYAVNLTQLFTPGVFSLRNLLATEFSGQAPVMFKIPWYENSSYQKIVKPEWAKKVTAPIPDNDSATVEGEYVEYMLYSFVVNTGQLRMIFPKGFEQSQYTNPPASGGTYADPLFDGNRALSYQVFKAVPLWPERPTYLSGVQGGSISAQKLYTYYHQ